MSQLRDIALKVLRGELPPLADGELAAERLKMCEKCPSFRKLARQCSLCSCFLDLKVKILEAKCPINAW